MKPFHLHVQSENKRVGVQDDFSMFEFQVGNSLPLAFIWEMVLRGEDRWQLHSLRTILGIRFPAPFHDPPSKLLVVLLLSLDLQREPQLMTARKERIQGNTMKCSVTKGCRLSKFPKTARMESWKRYVKWLQYCQISANLSIYIFHCFSHTLSSNKTKLFSIPQMCLLFLHLCPFAVPSAWNVLSTHQHLSISYLSYRVQFKSYLLQKAFSSCN